MILKENLSFYFTFFVLILNFPCFIFSEYVFMLLIVSSIIYLFLNLFYHHHNNIFCSNPLYHDDTFYIEKMILSRKIFVLKIVIVIAFFLLHLIYILFLIFNNYNNIKIYPKIIFFVNFITSDISIVNICFDYKKNIKRFSYFEMNNFNNTFDDNHEHMENINVNYHNDNNNIIHDT